MTKRLVSLLLAVLLLGSLALPAAAEEEPEGADNTLYITSVQRLLNLAERCRLDSYSQGLTVVLNRDLDLSGVSFESIPIFCGTFDGNGHTISGLTLAADGSRQGLFRSLAAGAVVRDLTVRAEIAPGGSRSELGAVAGSNSGLIQNCNAEVTLSGNEKVGGIAGTNGMGGIIENCQVRGSIQGSHFVGGVVGSNSGVVRGCLNFAGINVTAQENSVSLSEITMDSLLSTESATTVTDVGGIAGTSSGVIRGCKNTGRVGYPHMGYNVGGIAGTQSGYIANCENAGNIQGRKEVGGIVGQMEPAARVEYEEDALQILKRQLGGMSSLVSRTAANAQSAGDALYGHMGDMQSCVDSARESVDLLLPNLEEGPSLPDGDTIQAARNGLSSSLSGLNQSMQEIGATTASAVGTLSNNLSALQNQINAMSATLGNISETLGGSIEDVSDADTPEDLTGKAENCLNTGSVLADRHAGGITGAMALENDLTQEERWDIQGENSLNFTSEMRCVVLGCKNQGTVTVRKRMGGGIVGMQTLGLVKESTNLGQIEAEDASYVGGISGQSTGFIRDCAAKCRLSGDRYVGGIAGSAAIATGNHSALRLTGGRENLGAVLGGTEEDLHDEETPFAGNTYLVVDRDLGGIDGVSFAGQAQALPPRDFFAQERLEEMFKTATLTFCQEDGTQTVISVLVGESLPQNRVPTIVPKEGYTAFWDGLEEADLRDILFDRTYEARYESHSRVIQSEAPAGEAPLLLVEGDFYPGAALTAAESAAVPPLPEGETPVGCWSFSVTGYHHVTAGRLRLPEEASGELTLWVQEAGGEWTAREAVQDGSYLVFALDGSEQAAALSRQTGHGWYPYAAAGLAALAIIAATVVLRRRRRKGNGVDTKTSQ